MLHFHIVTIFPELFESRANIALFGKAQTKWLIQLHFINPREFTIDRHQTVDDKLYGWWEGLLMKAKPVIDAVNHAIELCRGDSLNRPQNIDSLNHPSSNEGSSHHNNFKILYPSPSTSYFNQQMAFDLTSEAVSWICNNLIFVCGRYEGIDQRFEQYFIDRYPEQFLKISLGKYIVYGGETPSMIIMEAITRLLPWGTHKPPLTESYYPEVGEDTIENPHYTRPAEIYGYKIPEILVSGHHKNIEKWRDDMMS